MFLHKIYKTSINRLDKKANTDYNHFRGNFLIFCRNTIKLEYKNILACKKVITKMLKVNNDKIFFFKPCKLLTAYKKSKSSRMGKGKGKAFKNYFLLRKGTILLEIQILIINRKILRDYKASIKTLISKLPCSTKFVFYK